MPIGNYKLFLIACLRGVAQIMLQANIWTGLLFLAGIFISSFTAGIATIVAVAAGTLTATILKYDKEDIQNGLYGFSAALVGIGLVFFFNSAPIIWVAIIIGAALATIIQHAFIIKKIPGYTFPFVIVTWLLIFFFNEIIFSSAPLITPSPEINNAGFLMPFKGYSQVMFINSYVTGIIFFIAVLANSSVAALYGIAGALLAGIIAHLLPVSTAAGINDGLFSFNAVLCSIALSGKRKTDALYVLLSVVLALLIQAGMIKMDWIVLTFPFVLSTWITLMIRKYFVRDNW